MSSALDRPRCERALLGCCLIRPEIVPEVSAVLVSTDFGIQPNRAFYDAVVNASQTPGGVDIAVVADAAGWDVVEASRLLDEAVSAAPWRFYAGKLRDARRRAQVLNTVTHTASRLRDPLKDVDTTAQLAIDELLSEVGEAMEAKAVGGAELVYPVLEDLDRRADPAYDPGPTFGLVDLDALLGGLGPGDLVLVAARPSVGKTALGLRLALEAAKAKRKAVFVSLEMGRNPITARMLALIGRISLYRTLHGRLSEGERERLLEAGRVLAGYPFKVLDTAASSIPEIRAECTKLKPDVLIVDYLQLVTPGEADTRNEEVSQISRALKRLAMEMHKPVVALSQLRRLETTRQPRLDDLRDSGSLEQDADVVVMLHADPARPKERVAIVAKHRNGPTGSVTLFWDGDQTRFDNFTRRAE